MDRKKIVTEAIYTIISNSCFNFVALVLYCPLVRVFMRGDVRAFVALTVF